MEDNEHTVEEVIEAFNGIRHTRGIIRKLKSHVDRDELELDITRKLYETLYSTVLVIRNVLVAYEKRLNAVESDVKECNDSIRYLHDSIQHNADKVKKMMTLLIKSSECYSNIQTNISNQLRCCLAMRQLQISPTYSINVFDNQGIMNHLNAFPKDETPMNKYTKRVVSFPVYTLSHSYRMRLIINTYVCDIVNVFDADTRTATLKIDTATFLAKYDFSDNMLPYAGVLVVETYYDSNGKVRLMDLRKVNKMCLSNNFGTIINDDIGKRISTLSIAGDITTPAVYAGTAPADEEFGNVMLCSCVTYLSSFNALMSDEFDEWMAFLDDKIKNEIDADDIGIASLSAAVVDTQAQVSRLMSSVPAVCKLTCMIDDPQGDGDTYYPVKVDEHQIFQCADSDAQHVVPNDALKLYNHIEGRNPDFVHSTTTRLTNITLGLHNADPIRIPTKMIKSQHNKGDDAVEAKVDVLASLQIGGDVITSDSNVFTLPTVYKDNLGREHEEYAFEYTTSIKKYVDGTGQVLDYFACRLDLGTYNHGSDDSERGKDAYIVASNKNANAGALYVKFEFLVPDALPLTSRIESMSKVHVRAIKATSSTPIIKEVGYINLEWKTAVRTEGGSQSLVAYAHANFGDIFPNHRVVSVLHVPSHSEVDAESSIRTNVTSSTTKTLKGPFPSKDDAIDFTSYGFYKYQGSTTYPVPSVKMELDLSLLKRAKYKPTTDEITSGVPIVSSFKRLFNADCIAIFSDRLICADGELELSVEPTLCKVSYIGDPLKVGRIDIMDLDLLQLQAYAVHLGSEIEGIQEVIKSQEKRIELIISTIERMSEMSLVSAITMFTPLAGMLSPIMGVVMQGLILVVNIADMIKSGVSSAGVAQTILGLIQFGIAVKTGLRHVNFSDVAERLKFDKFKYVWDVTAVQARNPMEGIYTGIQSTPVPLPLKTVNVNTMFSHYDAVGNNFYGKYIERIVGKIQGGQANPLERLVFKIHDKVNVVPAHSYVAIWHDDKGADPSKYTRRITVFGIADGNGAPITGNLKVKKNREIFPVADATGPGWLEIVMKKDASDPKKWQLGNWQDSGMSKRDIALAIGYGPNRKTWEVWSDDHAQERYKDVCSNYIKDVAIGGSASDGHWRTNIRPVNLLPGQLDGLKKLVEECSGRFKYGLLGSNCQTFAHDIIKLTKFSVKKPKWVTDEAWQRYLQSVHDAM